MWDSVPWFTEGQAEHSTEVARLLAYAAFGGGQGIVGSGDLAVRALSSPAAQVQVRPGACAILNRAAGATYQAYAGRLPTSDTVNIAATGSSARTDLIVARVENPYSYGETWPLPSNAATGPYIFTRVISGVPSTTTDVRQVRPNDSAITLARITIPANTSAITQGMIKDLRSMVSSRRDRVLYTAFPGTLSTMGYSDNRWHNWPGAASWDIDVPSWATRMKIVMTFAGLRMTRSDIYARMQTKFGSMLGQDTYIDDDSGTGTRRSTIVLADNHAVPSSMRGTTQTLSVQTYMYRSETGDLSVDAGTSIVADVEFVEKPDEEEV
ncbi:hypothetical protein [Streptomyces griseomycini]|uniref:Uncharacterized protein n=1 Tax=Streptomyces griseomycini TaxID=66895 RepID=A0A7W7VA26_9ACTN|nr:hypothetical protein [Streptomyces griseomycini]MBB4902504.1 hypothetical protein [Streptomyces griseomycini]GGR52091.1 hypothetical protein GCM10015536_66960 [Streptomyces griseomycini]